MIKYTTGFVDKLEDILEESKYTVRYERGNFQSGWCLLDHKRVVVLNKFLNTEGRVNTLVDLIPQLKIDYDKLTLSSQKLFDFLTENRLEKIGIDSPKEDKSAADATDPTQSAAEQPVENENDERSENSENRPVEQQTSPTDLSESEPENSDAEPESDTDEDVDAKSESESESDAALENDETTE